MPFALQGNPTTLKVKGERTLVSARMLHSSRAHGSHDMYMARQKNPSGTAIAIHIHLGLSGGLTTVCWVCILQQAVHI
jgi:hypothetical protein